MSISENPDPDDLLEWYWDNYVAHRSASSRRSMNSHLRFFKQFLEKEGIGPEDVDEDKAVKFLKEVREHYSPGTQDGIATTANRFYKYCLKKGVPCVNGNPIDIAMDEHSILDTKTNPPKYILTIDEMGDYLETMDYPFLFTSALLMAKTGRRIGAVVNLDLCDVNINHPACDWEVVPPLRRLENHLFFSPQPEEDRNFRGEIRKDSSKTKTATVVPIDDELRDALIWWLTVRGGKQEKNSPLFTKPGYKADWGQRTTTSQLGKRLSNKAKEEGLWYGPHDPDNVTAHYFRHFFNNRAKNRMPESIVNYIRGDKGATISQQSYDEWDNEKEQIYRKNIYKFF